MYGVTTQCWHGCATSLPITKKQFLSCAKFLQLADCAAMVLALQFLMYVQFIHCEWSQYVLKNNGNPMILWTYYSQLSPSILG